MGDTATSAAETPEQRQARLVKEFQNRLAHVVRSYQSCVTHKQSALNFNASIAASRQSLNPRARSKPDRKRVDAEFELLVNVRALALARERDPEATYPSQVDVNIAAGKLVAELKPRRGRPPDPILTHHVQAITALYRQTCGSDIRASLGMS
jgi:hypothetical protein